ncbi:MAG: energy transducer TonB family protein [Parvibaculaceae bacterium]
MTSSFVPRFDVSDYALSGDAGSRKRMGRSFIVVLALHAGVGLLALTWQTKFASPLAPPPAIIIDMTPTPPAPTVQPKVEPEKPKELPVVEKAEVVLKKQKPLPEKPKPKPQPEKKLDVPPAPVQPAAPVLSQAPVEARPAALRNYLSILYAHLQNYKKAPRHFGRMDERVVVNALIRRDGTLVSASLKTSSGSEKFDEAALSTLRRAAPLPPFTSDMPAKEMLFTIPVVFEEN